VSILFEFNLLRSSLKDVSVYFTKHEGEYNDKFIHRNR